MPNWSFDFSIGESAPAFASRTNSPIGLQPLCIDFCRNQTSQFKFGSIQQSVFHPLCVSALRSIDSSIKPTRSQNSQHHTTAHSAISRQPRLEEESLKLSSITFALTERRPRHLISKSAFSRRFGRTLCYAITCVTSIEGFRFAFFRRGLRPSG